MERLNKYEADAYVKKASNYIYVGKFYSDDYKDIIEKIRLQVRTWHSELTGRIYISLTDREKGEKEICINR